MNIGNVFLRSLVEATAEEKRRKRVEEELAKEQREADSEATERQARGEAMEKQAEADQLESDASAPEPEDVEAEQQATEEEGQEVPPQEESSEEDPLAMDDFSLDSSDAPPSDGEEAVPGEEQNYEDMPAPDGLPEPDATGNPEEGDPGEDPEAETNVHTNILNMSKLDRALAKRTIYQQFLGLRDMIRRTLSIIDKNEAAIAPEVRNKATTALNTQLSQISNYVRIRLQLVNYEEALEIYLLFSKQIKEVVDGVHESLESKGKKKDSTEKQPTDVEAAEDNTDAQE